ncbi:myb/SANT-like DNA-binding domain-containing protein 4 [Hypomesus transpacificus]|uniref:myb/SANT-like DNA-binding domain-containing protein 4 n=1 Tax=Hypomesus transpacificus TaxID=137520 RepID=UPI001F07D059|nr:myb/SANT-like DNA-binding domain-containing protein 4 [Hypomesus transpacificus]
MDKSRAAYFTEEEKTIILNKYEEFKHIIQEKSYTAAAARKRKDIWQKITDCVNACNHGSVKRSWEQIKHKHKNIIQTANRKEAGKTAGAPRPQDYPPAEELGLSNIQGGPLTEWGISPDTNGSSQTGIFVKVEGESLLLLSPPTLLHTKVEVLDDKEALSTCSERTSGEEGNLPPPEFIASTSRPSGSPGVGTDSVRTLYKRSLELDIEYKKLKIRKIQLEVEKLEHEKKEREKRMKPPE